MKLQKDKRVKLWGRLCMLAALVLVEAMFIQNSSLTVNAQGKTTVTANSGKIRESASTGSETLASVQKGAKLDVIAQTTDSDGYTWYKVYVDDSKTGYIRADLVGEISGSISTESASSSNNTVQEEDDEPVVQQTTFVQVTDSEAAAGKVTGESVNMRENPSTSANIVGKAKGGNEVTITGEATDTAGKVWYQVTHDGATGFIRSDFLEITQKVEPETEAPAEEPTEPEVEEAEPVNQDYELVYEANAEGVEEWFLYDYTRGTKQSLENLLTVVKQSQEQEQGAVAQLKTYKIAAIVMAALILALIIVVTILIFKLRDSYEYEYEDDDEDEDEDEMEDDEDEEEEEEVVRKPAARKTVIPARSVSHPKPEERQPVKTAPKQEPEKKDSSWQSKNFLDIDDDMEFEFLDLK